ncbi:MAG: hypothetical protein HYU64_00255 [Armatimonadetes bacterium]|nr:hypothetical protein [Armatimonadota bacterium]
MSKPHLQFSVPCLEVKENGGPPSFQHLFYELPLPEFPFKCPPFFISNGWCNGKGEFRQSIRILAPDKQQVIIDTGEQPFTLQEQTTPFMAVNMFAEVVFKEPGICWVQTFLDGSLMLEYPLTIRKAEVKR